MESTWKDKYCLSAPCAGLQPEDTVPGSRRPEMEGTSLFLEPGTEPSFCSSWKRPPRRDAVPGERRRWHHWGLFVQLLRQPADRLCWAVGWGQGAGTGPPPRQPAAPSSCPTSVVSGGFCECWRCQGVPAQAGGRGRAQWGCGARAPEEPLAPTRTPGSDSPGM